MLCCSLYLGLAITGTRTPGPSRLSMHMERREEERRKYCRLLFASPAAIGFPKKYFKYMYVYIKPIRICNDANYQMNNDVTSSASCSLYFFRNPTPGRIILVWTSGAYRHRRCRLSFLPSLFSSFLPFILFRFPACAGYPRPRSNFNIQRRWPPQ